MRASNLKSTCFVAMAFAIVAFAFITPQLSLAQYTVTTVAGGGPNGLAALSASIGYPGGIAVDGTGNTYIADSHSSRILKVSAAGAVTVVAGNGETGFSGDGGAATSAALNQPEAVALDSAGDIFIADTGNSVIREVTIANGNIQTVAGNFTAGAGYSGDGGAATSAQLNDPYGVFVDSSGNLFIADSSNCIVRKVSGGNIATVAGTKPNPEPVCNFSGDGGTATSATLSLPEGVFVDSAGNVFIADTDNAVVRVLNPGTAQVTIAGVAIGAGDIATVAGVYYNSEGGTDCATYVSSGIALTTQLCGPTGVFVDSTEDIFIADYGFSVVWEIAASSVNIATVAGNGTAGYSGDTGLATGAQLNYPNDVFVDGSGDIFIADTDNFVIREVTAGNINTVTGNNTLADSGDGGSPVDAELNYPDGVYVDSVDDIFIADSLSSVIRKVEASTGDIQTVAGNPKTVCTSPTSPCGDGGPATSAQFNSPYSVALDTPGNIYIADTGDNRIRVVNTSSGPITIAGVAIGSGYVATVAGNGTACAPGNYAACGDGGLAASAELSGPTGVFVDSSDNIFIVDTGDHTIREVASTTGIITTVAGNGTECPAPTTSPCGDGGPAASAQLNFPIGMFVDSSENIYISDTQDSRIRVVNTAGTPVTIAGVTIAGGDIATVAGTGAAGYAGDGGAATSALLANPQGLFVDASGDIFIADVDNFVIREVVSASGDIATVAGNNEPGFSGDGGDATSAEFFFALGLSGDTNGNLFVADTNNSRIRKLTPAAVTQPTAPAPPAQTTSPGGTASYSIELTANTGDPRYAITLSCLQSSLPTGASCSFSPAKITPGPLAVPFTLTITVPSGTASLEKPKGMKLQLVFAFVPLAGILFAGVGLRNKRSRWLLLAALGICLILLNACGGGGSGSGSGTTYNVQVQGTTTAQPNPVTITTAVLTVQ